MRVSVPRTRHRNTWIPGQRGRPRHGGRLHGPLAFAATLAAAAIAVAALAVAAAAARLPDPDRHRVSVWVWDKRNASLGGL